MKNIKFRAPAYTVLLATLIAALTVCMVLIVFMQRQLRILDDRLTRAQAYSAQIERELDEMKES